MEKNWYNDSTDKGYIEYLDYCRALGAFVIVMLHSGIIVCVWIPVSFDQRHCAAAGRVAPGLCSADAGDNCLFGG